jgi:aspartyl-tRNA(Asn)/glutamyl-tRNA(Gln) amidotransferase subunit A
MLGAFSLSAGYYDDFYAKAAKVRRLIRMDFEEAFQKVDLIAGPTSPVRAFVLGDRLNDPLAMYRLDSLTTPASLAGIPGISVPCDGEGLPVGLQILGPARHDGLVLRAAQAFEEMMHGI